MSTLDSLEENAKVLKAEIDEIKLKLENFKIWKSLANIIWVFVSAVALLWLQHFLGK
jgi:2'-5' RNA ligase